MLICIQIIVTIKYIVPIKTKIVFMPVRLIVGYVELIQTINALCFD